MLPISVRDVRFLPAGRPVLSGVDLELGGEGITVVLGPNGAGKSVLLRLLAGLLVPDAGIVQWGEHAAPAEAAAIVFQTAWAGEIRSRIAAIDAGTVELEPWDVAKRRIEKSIFGR